MEIKNTERTNKDFEKAKEKMVSCVNQVYERLLPGYGSTDNKVSAVLDEYDINSYLGTILEENLVGINKIRQDTGEKQLTQEEYQKEVSREFENFIKIVVSQDFADRLNSLEIRRDLNKIKEIIKEFGF